MILKLRSIYSTILEIDQTIRQQLQSELNKTDFGANEIAQKWWLYLPQSDSIFKRNRDIYTKDLAAKAAVIADLFFESANTLSLTEWHGKYIAEKMLAPFNSFSMNLKTKRDYLLGKEGKRAQY